MNNVKVDFYLLNEADERLYYRAVCGFVQQTYQQTQALYIYTESVEQAHKMDQLLWTFNDISFIPHSLETNEEKACMIWIGVGAHAKQFHPHAWLLNLTQTIGDFFMYFHRIIEFVPNCVKAKEQARKKYKQYKTKNLPLSVQNK